jgi:hypothetical protein
MLGPSRRSDFSRDPCRLSRLKPLLHRRQPENSIALWVDSHSEVMYCYGATHCKLWARVTQR